MRKALLILIIMVAASLFNTMVFAAVANDEVTSIKLKEADGTASQDTNTGSGVKTGHIQNSAVTTGKIADGAVTTIKILDSAVTSTKIANGAVTDAKITGTISGSKLGAHTHNGGDIINGTVTTAKIQDGAVTDTKIAGPISGSKISSTGLNADTVDGKHAADLASVLHTHTADDIVSGLIGVEKLHTYKNVLVVHKGAANGIDTFNTINSALSTIDNLGDSCTGNPYLIFIAPGVYEEDIVINSCVTLRGSGPENTKIVGTGVSMITIRVDRNVAIENLKVLGMNTAGPLWGIAPCAIWAEGGNVSIRNSIIDASVSFTAIVNAGPWVIIENSDIRGGSNSAVRDLLAPANLTIYNSRVMKNASGTNAIVFAYMGSAVRIVNSMIDGSLFASPGLPDITMRVINCYNASFDSIPNQ